MTEDQQRLLRNFETRVRQTMLLYESLQKDYQSLQIENEALKKMVDDKEAAFLKLREEFRETANNYDDLRLAKTISLTEGDMKLTKQRLAKLVREINACIALVNE